jgi:hypothetical protein
VRKKTGAVGLDEGSDVEAVGCVATAPFEPLELHPAANASDAIASKIFRTRALVRVSKLMS